MHSQTTLFSEPRVRKVITNGDTLIEMRLSDAKIVLGGLLDGQIVDSLLNVYTLKDSINTNIITLQTKEIIKLQQKSANQELQLSNLNKIISNNTIEVNLLNDIIKKQKKEIIKQKTLKIIGFIAAVAIPITIIIFFPH